MLCLTKPSDEKIREYLRGQENEPFSYAVLGATRDSPPSGYTVDRYRLRLGAGPEAFARAADALRRWEMFHLSWARLCYPDTSLRAGETVVAIFHHFGIWSMNPARIVYTIDDESESVRRIGFAYGTLRDHAESGEERFLIEWTREDDNVWYDVVAFSRPRHPLARMAFPLARLLQKRFARDSKAVMRLAVSPSE